MIALVLSTSLVTGLLMLVGHFGIQQWFPKIGTEAMYPAAAINLLAGWISFVPVALVSRSRMTEYMPQAAMGAMVIRILIVAFALLGLMFWGPWDDFTISIWMLVFYLSLLIVETIVAVRAVQKFDAGRKFDTSGGNAQP